MEAMTQNPTSPGADALKRILSVCGHTLSPYGSHWTGITWYPGALQRLGECGGLILGVSVYDEPLAERMALSLVRCLDRLDSCGPRTTPCTHRA